MIAPERSIHSQTIQYSVVTPTLNRPDEVRELIANLTGQTALPFELILVDGAPPENRRTERVVEELKSHVPFSIQYIRHSGGTAIQRNRGLDIAAGDYIALVDDDIRLEPEFFTTILGAFEQDTVGCIGGITGYITNSYLDPATSTRWQWYRRLKLFTTYEPGRYDYQTGYPINRYLQPPHTGLREIDFMGAGCVVWRRTVIDSGLRFSEFFVGFGVLEDAHFALRAGRRWKLMEHGAAHCEHLHAASSRENARLIARKTAVNYRFVFIDIVPQRTLYQELRFWRVQFFDHFRILLYALRHPDRAAWLTVLGKAEGILAALRLKTPSQTI